MFKRRTTMQIRAGSKEDRWRHFLARIGGVNYKPDARRTNQRYTADGDVRISFVEDGDSQHRMLRLLDISIEGMTVKGSNEVPQGTHLTIQLDMDEGPFAASGKVVHCTGTLGGFKIGIRLDLRDDDDARESDDELTME